jgi:RimJ/RimL family protein N-acetyltransferase
MIELHPATLEGHGVRLEPLSAAHHDGLAAAAADGKLWELWFTSVPEPEKTRAVRELASGAIIGSTRYHDIVKAADRVEIGYTWYAKRFQKTHVNTACKLLLLEFAFDKVRCGVVGLRTDNFNFNSQKAIEALGAKKDGVIRRHWPRRDGTIRDTVLYSILATEWPDVRRHLERRLARNAR